MIIRRLESTDCEELEAVDQLTVAAYVGGGLISADSEYAVELRSAAKRAREARLLISVGTTDATAGAGGTGECILGTVTYCPGGTEMAEVASVGEAGIRMLAVAKMARGHGVGQALVQTCIDQARESGATTIRLSTKIEMCAAHRLYERLGFYRTPKLDWFPTPTVALLTYALDLS